MWNKLGGARLTTRLRFVGKKRIFTPFARILHPNAYMHALYNALSFNPFILRVSLFNKRL